MTLTFETRQRHASTLEVAVSPTTGFTYEVHNKWGLPRGQGYAVFVRDCATGKSTTGNKAAFYTKNQTSCAAKKFCEDHNAEMNNA